MVRRRIGEVRSGLAKDIAAWHRPSASAGARALALGLRGEPMRLQFGCWSFANGVPTDRSDAQRLATDIAAHLGAGASARHACPRPRAARRTDVAAVRSFANGVPTDSGNAQWLATDIAALEQAGRLGLRVPSPSSSGCEANRCGCSSDAGVSRIVCPADSGGAQRAYQRHCRPSQDERLDTAAGESIRSTLVALA